MMPARARLVLGGTVLAGACLLAADLASGVGEPSRLLFAYLALTASVSLLDIRLQARGGDISLGIVFALAGFVQLTLPQVYLLGLAAGLFPLAKCRLLTIDAKMVAFQAAVAVLSLKSGYLLYEDICALLPANAATTAIILSCPALVGVSSFLLALYEAAQQRVRLRSIWPKDYAWSLIYYIGCSAAAALIVALSYLPLLQFLLIVLPLLLLAGRALRDQRRAMDLGREQSNQFTGLQMGVLQVLGQALEAREGRGVIHFERLGRYAHGLGKAMGLEGIQLMALETGALLHDVGKLAVPDYLLTKPGKLTPEEFDLLKKHPVVGAEIISKANLPYPVAPLVYSHQENWDGSGYPDGRKGADIPTGARILRVLDALDALTADRSYRRGLSLQEAIAEINRGAGTSFDPKLVQVLSANYKKWEQAIPSSAAKSSMAARTPTQSVTSVIAEARQEEKTLSSLNRLFKASLDLEGTLLRLERELGAVIPHETMVLFRLNGESLQTWHVCGENYRLFQNVDIPLGRGVSGLVARTGRGLADGLAAADLLFTPDAGGGCRLKSMLSVPLSSEHTTAGVLSLYSENEHYFTADHLRLLAALAPSLASWLETSMLYMRAESRASTDALTGLPNNESLFSHLQNEIARALRGNLPLSVVVCDLDGFKSVNDRFGHLTGNELLKCVASGLRSKCREYDFVARMGGDEFVLIMPGLDREAAISRCPVMEEVVIAAGVKVCGEQCIGMSAGISQLGYDGRNPDELVAAADLRMYEQKQTRKAAMLSRSH
ncbi:MAG: diguanylate cyclase [Bryobacteraceae bacterium]|nr:diguanylate cyclase [Bryobacteraceae bacterium]